jgi:hypothetical protein
LYGILRTLIPRPLQVVSVIFFKCLVSSNFATRPLELFLTCPFVDESWPVFNFGFFVVGTYIEYCKSDLQMRLNRETKAIGFYLIWPFLAGYCYLFLDPCGSLPSYATYLVT